MRGGYKIKWLSDTRALIIFEHPTTGTRSLLLLLLFIYILNTQIPHFMLAKKAYIDNVTHPLAKIRPYEGPTDFLKGK
jgi:hypothetical protein